MMKGIPLVAALMLLLPWSAFAATYSYVDIYGNNRTVVAANATEALTIAPQIAPHSGVQLEMGSVQSGFGSGSVLGASSDEYHYVDMTGTVRTVTATNAVDAFNLATDIALHSGVAVDVGLLDEGDTVPGV
jgi:hypothetical protein